MDTSTLTSTPSTTPSTTTLSTTTLSTRQITDTFLDFYRERGHQLVGDATLIPPPGDPVLFTSAGMHPLTPYFEGRPHPSAGAWSVSNAACAPPTSTRSATTPT